MSKHKILGMPHVIMLEDSCCLCIALTKSFLGDRKTGRQMLKPNGLQPRAWELQAGHFLKHNLLICLIINLLHTEVFSRFSFNES